jgi:hypothetical protein
LRQGALPYFSLDTDRIYSVLFLALILGWPLTLAFTSGFLIGLIFGKMLLLAMLGRSIIPLKPEKRFGEEAPAGVPTSAAPQNPEKSRIIEVTIPDERYRETPLLFKVPAWDNLAASANRLLKFEFPPTREVRVYERLIKTNGVSTGLSKKILESLPVPWLETIYRELWQPVCGRVCSSQNDWLTLFMLVEEISEFNAEQWVQQDIRLLGERDTGAMHSYYYRGVLNRENLMALLSGHGYRTDFLTALEDSAAEDEATLQLAYLACRRLSRPLPWVELLAQLQPADLLKSPRLTRLKGIQALLSATSWAVGPLAPADLLTATEHVQALQQQAEVAEVAALSGIPRPVKELVIVEGETEKLLLPLFAEAMGLDFNALGISILPAGGKNHVLALYRENARNLRVPICVLLDSDAEEIVDELSASPRPQDYIFHIAEGEFEDMYDLELILKVINLNYQPYPELTLESFKEMARSSNAKGRVHMLRVVWQAYNLGSFDKIDFAGKYAELFKPRDTEKFSGHSPTAIQKLVEIILQVRTGLA